uniref:Uncharacterized protein n=1 Tax=Mus musculus TaxID=10090 RepID=Q3UF15_MOUSE|nr:unnamed protein product [Mus musculus]
MSVVQRAHHGYLQLYLLLQKYMLSRAWWPTPFIPALGRQRLQLYLLSQKHMLFVKHWLRHSVEPLNTPAPIQGFYSPWEALAPSPCQVLLSKNTPGPWNSSLTYWQAWPGMRKEQPRILRELLGVRDSLGPGVCRFRCWKGQSSQVTLPTFILKPLPRTENLTLGLSRLSI